MTASPLLRCVSAMFVALAALAGLWSLQPALGAKPAPTHTSTIFYRSYSSPINYKMYEDGTSKTTVNLPQGVVAHPSNKTYGGVHWWITTGLDPVTGLAELFAFASDGTPPVQLTSLGADMNVGVAAYDDSHVPRWSNDGLDRFVTFHADTLAGFFLCRLWITAADIAAIELGAPHFTSADIERVFAPPPGYLDYGWSNSDGLLAYTVSNNDTAGHPVSRTIWVRALSNPPTDLPIYTRTNSVGWIGPALQWAQDGSRIAFTTGNGSAWGGVWTIKPDGTLLRQVQTNSGTMSYSSSLWSPDSKELLLQTTKSKLGSVERNLARMPAAGGTLTTLTSDLLPNVDKTAVGWTVLSP